MIVINNNYQLMLDLVKSSKIRKLVLAIIHLFQFKRIGFNCQNITI